MKLAMKTNIFGGLKAKKYLFKDLFITENKKEGYKSFHSKKASRVKNKEKFILFSLNILL